MNLKHRRWLVPEVVQTSAMDCGPAALKCLLEGFEIPVSYGRLREACQTDVDGTSIDTMEEIAVQLGLEAEQIMVPPDYMLLEETNALPAIAVVSLPTGMTHFVLVWRKHGPLVQTMDPAAGRRWLSRERLLSTLHLHTQLAPLADWREWATSEKFLRPLRRKLSDLGCSISQISRLTERAAADNGWRPLAALEAAIRTVEALVFSRSFKRGSEASKLVERLFVDSHATVDHSKPSLIPPHFWSVSGAPSDPDGTAQVFFRGAVLVHANGRRQEAVRKLVTLSEQLPEQEKSNSAASPEISAALEQPQAEPYVELFRLLRADGVLAPACIASALLFGSIGVMIEALLFRSLLDLAHKLGAPVQRIVIIGAAVLFLAGMLTLEFPVASGLLRIGRKLEARLRIAFQEKIPRLGDRYFHSRLNSDMAGRYHQIHHIRLLPELGGRLLRSTFELLFTAAGVIWLDPGAAPLIISMMFVSVGLNLAIQPALAERDMRVQNHAGALSCYYLDAFLGLVPLRAHRAEHAFRRRHEVQLGEWTQAEFSVQRLVVWVEALQFFSGFGLAAWILLDHISRSGDFASILLLVYWALNLPFISQEIAEVAWQYPTLRNKTLRLLEPLSAPVETANQEGDSVVATLARKQSSSEKTSPGVTAVFENVSVRLAGHMVLEEINLEFSPGSHIAVVGPSGAGKSSLLGLLLGWYRPAAGKILINGAPLTEDILNELRGQTAWVDPAVQLWNRTLFENLVFGASPGTIPESELLKSAELHSLLKKLPAGLQTELGENGGLVSGGEGQRVRLGRSLHRRGVRLAILDEPFRGLDRQQRRDLMSRARKHWNDATLLCVTHDVGETLSFPRVLVVDSGRIVEDGSPEELVRRPDSTYKKLLLAEEEVREGFWSNNDWQHLHLRDGQLQSTEKVSA
jgi:ABC-type bacteriocin/lantibiotic exporter with double-glycine peptidase domain